MTDGSRIQNSSSASSAALTSPVADPIKIARVVDTGTMVVVDHARHVQWYREAAGAANVQVPVLVGLDTGHIGPGAGAAYRWGGDEFGFLDAKFKLAQRIEFVPPHCDRGLQPL